MAVTKQLKIGNGGANYNTAEATLKRQIAQNQSNIASNANYKQNETQRALQVIQQRQAAGLDTSAQQKYLTTNLGYKAPTTQAQPTAAPFKPINTQSANTQQGSELMGLMKQIATKQSTPFSYDVNSDPEYQAALKRAQANIKTGTNQTMAEMNRRGILNSTITSDRSDEIAADQMGRVETEVVPALVSQAYQRYQNQQAQEQQQLANMGTLAQMYQGEDQRGFGNKVTEAGLTGNYMPEGAQGIVDNILSLKQQAEAKGVTAQQRAQYSAQADGLRAQLLSMGVNPNAYAANVNSTAARAVNPGIRTLQAQQQDLAAQGQAFTQNLQTAQYNQGVRQYDQNFAYQVARDAITDKQWQAAFDRDVNQFGMNYALQKLQESNNQSYRQASLALDRDRLGWDQDKSIVDAEAKRAQEAAQNMTPQAFAKSYINPLVKRDDEGVVLNKNDVIAAAVASGYNESQIDGILAQYGVTSEDIKTFQKSISGN